MGEKIRRGALIGFGRVAEGAHVPAFVGNPRFRLDAVVDGVPARLEAARRILPHAFFYEDAENFFAAERGLDFVVIATPPSSHAPLVLRALGQGLNVLCEKPLALSLHDLERIEELARRREKTVFTVHNWAYSPLWVKAAELVKAGALGELSHAELHTLRTQPAAQAGPGSWRGQAALAGGGIAIDHGWHSLYLLCRLFGAEATRVTAALRRPGPGAVEEEASVLLEFPAASALLRLSWRAAERSNWGVIEGRRGTLELRDDHLILRRDGRSERFSFPEKLSAGSAHPEWLAAMLEDFHAELSLPRRRHSNLREARFCVEALRKIYAPRRVRGDTTKAVSPRTAGGPGSNGARTAITATASVR